jgi:mannose-1-phosphate guanylyltransferase/mannose-6-phosphate isomerase
MIVTIIAGGAGTRLWPLSTPTLPKHLLKLGGEKTLLRMSYERAAETGEEVYVVTEKSHAAKVAAELPELASERILIEPARRGTANCILMALDIISRRHGAEHSVAFIHSDHLVEDKEAFVNSFRDAERASREAGAITLLGIEPRYPATTFGYIKKGERRGRGDVYEVARFKEKPDAKTAEAYLESGGYLWNAGYFIGSPKIFLDEINRSAPALQSSLEALRAVPEFPREEYDEVYISLESDAIDFALMEKAKDLLVFPAGFDWADLGTFRDLHDLFEKDESGNCLEGLGIALIDSSNVYVHSDGKKPVAVVGLDNIVVVNAEEGLLVAKKDKAHLVGEAAKKLAGGSK